MVSVLILCHAAGLALHWQGDVPFEQLKLVYCGDLPSDSKVSCDYAPARENPTFITRVINKGSGAQTWKLEAVLS